MRWLEAGFVVLCLYFAWRDGVELFVAWYSGSEDQVPSRVFWLAIVRVALLVATAVATVVFLWWTRDPN